jgi:hypothetical protein
MSNNALPLINYGAFNGVIDFPQNAWKTASISFSTGFNSGVSFNNTPIVIVTPNNNGVNGHNSAVTAVVTGISTSGFNVSLKTLDTTPGQAGFYWMAVSIESSINPPPMPTILTKAAPKNHFATSGTHGRLNESNLCRVSPNLD